MKLDVTTLVVIRTKNVLLTDIVLVHVNVIQNVVVSVHITERKS